MAALQRFLEQELPRRGWSIEEFARRASISTSLGYLIIRDGKDNVRQDTFENIADALHMTPAELMVAIGKGAQSDDPKRTPLVALIRQVPDDELGTIDRVIRPFAVEPITKRRKRFGRSNPPGVESIPSQLDRGNRYFANPFSIVLEMTRALGLTRLRWAL